MPLVSVILPVYNTEKYLPRCIESLLSQTLKDIEIILVDDGSTDGSVALIEAYAQKDERVRLIRQPNSGAGAARNNGLANALGEAVQFLDSDDYFEPDMLEETYRKLKEDDAEIVIFQAFEHDETTGQDDLLESSLRISRCPGQYPFPSEKLPRFLFNNFRLEVWNKLFRTRFIRENGICFQNIANTNDIAFTMEALAAAKRITLCSKPLVHYCVNRPGSLQFTRDKAPTLFYQAYLEARKRLEKRGCYRRFEQSFLYSLIVCICDKYKNLKTDEGRKEQRTFIAAHAERDFGLLKHAACYYNNPERLDEYASLLGIENYRKSFRHRLLYAVQFLPCKIRGFYCRLNGLK